MRGNVWAFGFLILFGLFFYIHFSSGHPGIRSNAVVYNNQCRLPENEVPHNLTRYIYNFWNHSAAYTWYGTDESERKLDWPVQGDNITDIPGVMGMYAMRNPNMRWTIVLGPELQGAFQQGKYAKANTRLTVQQSTSSFKLPCKSIPE